MSHDFLPDRHSAHRFPAAIEPSRRRYGRPFDWRTTSNRSSVVVKLETRTKRSVVVFFASSLASQSHAGVPL